MTLSFSEGSDTVAHLICMVWIVADTTIPWALPRSEELRATECEASRDAQNLEGGVRT